MLRCEGLHKSFGGVKALADVSFSFPTAGVVALIGPNGAGKTTLLNILTGFLRPDAGRFYLGEHELTWLPPHKVAQLGIARSFQDLRLIRQISVLDNVMLAVPGQKGETLFGALTRRGVARQEWQGIGKAKRVLEFVGLSRQAEEPAEALSYGQQKLLALACGLATDARVLFLDEPVAGVDPATVPQILGRLRTIGAEGKLIVFIEHNVAAVRQAADLVIVMDSGEIIAHGAPGEVLDRPEINDAYVG